MESCINWEHPDQASGLRNASGHTDNSNINGQRKSNYCGRQMGYESTATCEI
jgi:hypothetical protein